MEIQLGPPTAEVSSSSFANASDRVSEASALITMSRDDVDLESGPGEQPQCRICLESDGRDFIAPCKCKGSSKYVHRVCLDHWRAVKEGFAFAHCTTCKAPYYLRVQVPADRKWRTLKFRFFVTRDIILIFALVQMVTISLGYLVYLGDHHWNDRLRLAWHYDNSVFKFYYICGALLFLLSLVSQAVSLHVMIVECGMILRNPAGICVFAVVILDCHLPGTLCMWTDCAACFEGCAGAAGECGTCLGGAGEAGAPVILIAAVVALALFTIVGIFYSVLVATMVGQRIWQRHYHILAKRMLTKEYVVEDLDGEILGPDWAPPPLAAEHVQQLRSLGLM